MKKKNVEDANDWRVVMGIKMKSIASAKYNINEIFLPAELRHETSIPEAFDDIAESV